MPETLTNTDPIAHPLDRLRGLIRRYVLIDGLLTAGLFAILWYWIGLAADYGLFKATHFDWVLDAPKLLRVVAFAALALVLLGILFTRLWQRLHRELSYPSLALVLEKRFPKILGDRLITAVELADVAKAKSQGYSEDMLRATIEEAREKVKEVPVSSVFNWKRLRKKGILLGLFAVGTLLVVYGGWAAIRGNASPGLFYHRFGDVSMIWAERNLLLRNTPWPRNAHIELINFPGEEHRVGKDAAAPKVTARAYKWVVADRGAVHGWRPLMYDDLPEHFSRELGSVWMSPEVKGWDADRVESAHAASSSYFHDVFLRLDELAANPAYSRKLRKLAIPDDVILSYNGPKTSGKVSFTREANNVFTGEVSGLKESVRFTVKGGDFATTPRSITLVPPPMFTRLTRTEYQPAYLYHPPPSDKDDWAALKGLRQTIAEKDLSLTGDKSVFSIVQGTEFDLAGTADKRLKSIKLKPKIGPLPGQNAPTDVIELEPQGENHDSFRVAFRGKDRPQSNLEFEIVLEDTDGVTTTRSILVQVTEDAAPMVDLAVDVLRKQGNNYLVTPIAMVPFLTESKIRDDLALGKVEFVYTITQVETGVVLAVQAQVLAAAFGDVPLMPNIGNAMLAGTAAFSVQSITKAESKETGSVMVTKFAEQFKGLNRMTLKQLQDTLAQPAPADLAQIIREVKMQNQTDDYFDLKLAIPKLAEGAESGELARRYRVEVTLVATDANVETGPKTGTSLEPIKLVIVSEAELLTEISRDEESQATKLDDVIRKLEGAQGKLSQTADRLLPLSLPPDVLTAAAVRAQDIAQDIAKAREITAGILTECRRLEREEKFNRVRAEIIERFSNEIVAGFDRVLEKQFPDSEQAHQQVQVALAENRRPDDAAVNSDRFALTTLIAELHRLREKFGESVSINKLRNELVALHARQKAIGKVLKDIRENLIRKLYYPELRMIPVVELNKGETKTIKHPMTWNLFTGGTLVVKFEGPGPDVLKLPETVKVADDREDFDYAITAGQKPGEYKVTLTPTAGNPVVVTVRVK